MRLSLFNFCFFLWFFKEEGDLTLRPLLLCFLQTCLSLYLPENSGHSSFPTTLWGYRCDAIRLLEIAAKEIESPEARIQPVAVSIPGVRGLWLTSAERKRFVSASRPTWRPTSCRSSCESPWTSPDEQCGPEVWWIERQMTGFPSVFAKTVQVPLLSILSSMTNLRHVLKGLLMQITKRTELQVLTAAQLEQSIGKVSRTGLEWDRGAVWEAFRVPLALFFSIKRTHSDPRAINPREIERTEQKRMLFLVVLHGDFGCVFQISHTFLLQASEAANDTVGKTAEYLNLPGEGVVLEWVEKRPCE